MRHVNALLLAQASLVRVNTTLPVHVLLGGWQSSRVVDELRARNMTLHYFEPLPIPRWAKNWYRGTFCKLTALRLAYTLRKRVLFLDSDVVAFRNVDHLDLSPAPAFAFRDYGSGFKAAGSGLNSGVMLLPVLSRAQLDEAMRLYHSHLLYPFERSMVGADGSDQAFWSAWLTGVRAAGPGGAPGGATGGATRRPVYELSARYNLYADEVTVGNASDAWWRRVLLWHKPQEKQQRLPPEARHYVGAALRGAQALAPRISVPAEDESQPRAWCEGSKVHELFISTPPIRWQGTLGEAKTQQVALALAVCRQGCARASTGATWCSVSLQIDACTCHSTCNATHGRVRSGGGAFGLKTSWTEAPSAWFAAPIAAPAAHDPRAARSRERRT